MWLLVDIGNSAVKIGLFDPTVEVNGQLLGTRRIEPTSNIRSEVATLIGTTTISRVGGVSVVPSLTPIWRELAEELCPEPSSFFNSTSQLPFELKYETPLTLGNDRIAVAAGGWTRFGVPNQTGVIVVDAGTAINYEVVTSEGAYLGGVIAPGPGLMRQALNVGTAQLPGVELEIPPQRIGRSTNEAIRSGIMFGLRDAVHSMIEGIKRENAMPFEVVLTGGWGEWLASELSIHFESELVLKGVADLMRFSAE
ncbi:type III pantothenate kinase [bacterium]|nr:type III pantothenate kinase [bacterium]